MLLSACSHNMLVLFLLSNLMTGAVNLSINPMSIPDGYARVIVSIYMVLLCLIAYKLYSRNVQLTTLVNNFLQTKQSGKGATARYRCNEQVGS